MSIEQMTFVSYLLFAAAIALALTAVILFFALDIRKCGKIVAGGKARRKTVNKHKKTDFGSIEGKGCAKKDNEATLPLNWTENEPTMLIVEKNRG